MEIKKRDKRVVKIEVSKNVLDYNGDIRSERSLREIELPVDIPLIRKNIEDYLRWALQTSDRLGIWWVEEQSIMITVYDPEELVDVVYEKTEAQQLFDNEPTPIPSLVVEEDIQDDEFGEWPASWYNWSTD